MPNCKAARRERGICEVLTDDKEQFKVVADARLKLEKRHGSCYAVCGKSVDGNLRLAYLLLMPAKDRQMQKQEHAHKVKRTTCGSHCQQE